MACWQMKQSGIFWDDTVNQQMQDFYTWTNISEWECCSGVCIWFNSISEKKIVSSLQPNQTLNSSLHMWKAVCGPLVEQLDMYLTTKNISPTSFPLKLFWQFDKFAGLKDNQHISLNTSRVLCSPAPLPHSPHHVAVCFYTTPIITILISSSNIYPISFLHLSVCTQQPF